MGLQNIVEIVFVITCGTILIFAYNKFTPHNIACVQGCLRLFKAV